MRDFDVYCLGEAHEQGRGADTHQFEPEWNSPNISSCDT